MIGAGTIIESPTGGRYILLEPMPNAFFLCACPTQNLGKVLVDQGQNCYASLTGILLLIERGWTIVKGRYEFIRTG